MNPSLNLSTTRKIILKSNLNLPSKTKRFFSFLISINFLLTTITIELPKYYFLLFNAANSFSKMMFPKNYNYIENCYFGINVFFPLVVGYCQDYLGARRGLTLLSLMIFLGNCFFTASSFQNEGFLPYSLEYSIIGVCILSIGGESMALTFFSLIVNYYSPECVAYGLNYLIAFGLFGKAFIFFMLSLSFLCWKNRYNLQLYSFTISITILSILSLLLSIYISFKDYKYKEKIFLSDLLDFDSVSYKKSIEKIPEKCIENEKCIDNNKLNNENNIRNFSIQFPNETINNTTVIYNYSLTFTEYLSESRKKSSKESIKKYKEEEYNDEIFDVYPYTFWQSFKEILNFRQLLISFFIAFMISNFYYFLLMYFSCAPFDEIFICLKIPKIPNIPDFDPKKFDPKLLEEFLESLFTVYVIVFAIFFFFFLIAGIIVFFIRKHIVNTGNRTFFMLLGNALCWYGYYSFSELIFAFKAEKSLKIFIYFISMIAICIGMSLLYGSMYSCIPILSKKINIGASFGFLYCLNAIFILVFFNSRGKDVVTYYYGNKRSPIPAMQKDYFMLISDNIKICSYNCLYGFVVLVVIEIYDQANGCLLVRKAEKIN